MKSTGHLPFLVDIYLLFFVFSKSTLIDSKTFRPFFLQLSDQVVYGKRETAVVSKNHVTEQDNLTWISKYFNECPIKS